MSTTASSPTAEPADPGRGRRRQSQIYGDGARGRRPDVPTDPQALERRAKRAMSRRAWAYVSGGAGEGRTMRHNRDAFDRWRIVPRVLHGVGRRELRTEILGTPLSAPLLVAPIGAAGLVRADSDLRIAQGAAATGTPYVFSSQGCNPLEDTARAMGTTPFWYQLYWSTDEQLVDSMIQRAERSGAAALVVTVDTTVLGWRPQDLDLGSLPFARGEGIAQYTSDPRFLTLAAERAARPAPAVRDEITVGAIATLLAMARNHPGRLLDNLRSGQPRAAVQTFLDIYSNPGLSWDHLATLKQRTCLPVLVKGILHPDDARRAFELGLDGIVVSNHGGRQVDSAVASLDALVAVRESVGPERVVVFDSGIRSGADVFVALALGADACLLGRPHVYGLALAGADGVRQVIDNLVAELDLIMGLTGVERVADIGRDHVLDVTEH